MDGWWWWCYIHIIRTYTPVSDTHSIWSALTCYDVVGSHDHDGSDADAEDGILAPVEEGQAGGGLQRCLLILLQLHVILLRFVLLVVEIL